MPTAQLLFDARAEILEADGAFFRLLVELFCYLQSLHLLCEARHLIWRAWCINRLQVVLDNVLEYSVSRLPSQRTAHALFLMQNCARPAV